MGVFMVSRLECKTLYIGFIDLVVLLLSLSPSSPSRFDQRPDCLIGVQKGQFISFVEISISKRFELVCILNFTDLSEFNRIVQLSFNPCDLLKFIFLLSHFVMLSNGLEVVRLVNFRPRRVGVRSWRGL
jgi:hypothetical protein